MTRLTATIIALAIAFSAWLGTRALDAVALEERTTWPKTHEIGCPTTSPAMAPIVFAGFREVAADFYWICSLTYFGASLAGEADYRNLPLYIDNVLALDPSFERPYSWAMRSVVFKTTKTTQADYQIALRYALAGAERFPDKHEFILEAGYLYYFDLVSDDEKETQRYRELGADYIDRAVRKPDAPDELANFAASLRTKMGQKERALRNLREMILITDNPEAQQQLLERYEELAREQFPDEAKRATEELDKGWKREFPYAGPSMYILLGDRPSRVIEFDELATDHDLFGADRDPGQ